MVSFITWGNIDLARAVLTVIEDTAKSGSTRHIPINAETLSVLQQWRERACLPLELVFPVASKLAMDGVDLNTIRELLGHSDIQMILRYAHLAPQHKAKAVAVLLEE